MSMDCKFVHASFENNLFYNLIGISCGTLSFNKEVSHFRKFKLRLVTPSVCWFDSRKTLQTEIALNLQNWLSLNATFRLSPN